MSQNVKIVSEDGFVTKLYTADGSQIKGVRKLSVHFEGGKPAYAEAELVFLDVSADGVFTHFKALNPNTNTAETVKSITFDSGETVYF